ncbi:MAG: 4'-phosphopantetheinyl transferase [Candidatus Dependentiae bacterium ADurb.Bin331]|nr:MAG: 4'-phosphopantetheinyl transferase [Candidatus Dependentiae bacterium ADurb.Bin331]
MNIALGLDAVEISRFGHWHAYTDAQLLKIFSPAEIIYCRSISVKSAERFAARFAAKEAFFKALCQLFAQKKLSFLPVAKHVTLQHHTTDSPYLAVQWQLLSICAPELLIAPPEVKVSVTHTKQTAIVCVILIGQNS